ncbi:hypothetical protein D3C78_1450980 [compost metagenome]
MRGDGGGGGTRVQRGGHADRRQCHQHLGLDHAVVVQRHRALDVVEGQVVDAGQRAQHLCDQLALGGAVHRRDRQLQTLAGGVGRRRGLGVGGMIVAGMVMAVVFRRGAGCGRASVGLVLATRGHGGLPQISFVYCTPCSYYRVKYELMMAGAG